MKTLVLWLSTKNKIDRRLADIAVAGAEHIGWRTETRPVTEKPDGSLGDLGAWVGTAPIRKVLTSVYRRAGVPFLHFDKGFSRQKLPDDTPWWRISYDAHQPTAYLGTIEPDHARARSVGWELRPSAWKRDGPVLFTAPSPRTVEWLGLGGRDDHLAVSAKIVKRIKKFRGDIEVIVRPKPTVVEHYRAGIPGATMNLTGSMTQAIEGCSIHVTHTSGACIDATLSGIPTVTLANCPTAAIGPVGLHPDTLRTRPFDRKIAQDFLGRLSRCQWSRAEIESGQYLSDWYDIYGHNL